MENNLLVTTAVLESRPIGLLRAVDAVRERLGRFARARTSTLGDVVDVGSIVRVFAVDALREATLILSPEGVSETAPGVVPADSPIAAALLGGRVGETRRWESPSGTKRLEIVDIVGRMPAGAAAPAPAHRPVRRAAVPARRQRTLPLPEAA